MNYIRTIEQKIIDNINKKPIFILYGARQVGKTTLVRKIMQSFSKSLYLAGDDPKTAPLLEGRSGTELVTLIAGHDIVIIDEAQKIKNIGTVLKLIADQKTSIPVIATGSSSFELSNKISEPLTGRNKKYKLHPLSLPELVHTYGQMHIKNHIEEYIIYGQYPEVVSNQGLQDKKETLKEIANDYLYKDLFLFGDIRNPFAFQKLVQLLALRIGSETSYSELAKEIGISRDTVMNYVHLLEQAFVIFRLTPLYTNKTKEINKNHKIYFYDTGIRNAVINAYGNIETRLDKGALFENFFIAEKMKQRDYSESDTKVYFWRNRQEGEVDFVETLEQGGAIHAYECKYKDNAKMPRAFSTQYPQADFQVVTIENIVNVFI
jgi:predicted AAA+ superfamily ATPase